MSKFLIILGCAGLIAYIFAKMLAAHAGVPS